MRNLTRHIFIVLAVIVLAVWAVYPPQTKLRLGKDLAGGTSLVYQANLRSTDSPDTLPRMIELVKRRLDPNGVMEIQVVASSNNRLEITMPLPGDRVKQLRAQFESDLAALVAANVSVEQFDQAVALPPDQRPARLAELSGGDQARLTLLREAAEKSDAAAQARALFNAREPELSAAIETIQAELEAAREQGDEALAAVQARLDVARAALDEAAREPAVLERQFETLRGQVLDTTMSAVEVRRALDLPNADRRYKDAAGVSQVIPSPRARALARLKERHPGVQDRLDRVVAAWDTFQAQRSTLDDPSDVVRLLRNAGVLSFRIAPAPGEHPEEDRLIADLQRVGPKNVRATDARWYKINKLDSWFDTNEALQALIADPRGYFAQRRLVGAEFDGQYYLLLYDTRGKRLTAAEGAWRLDGANQGFDQLGRKAIDFRMDALGGQKLGDLTGPNVEKPMAVLLDDEVYTAPTLQSRISRSGQITGTFSDEEIRYIVRVLSAGSLAAKLSPEPISTNTIGPELGLDNLQRGLQAGLISFVFVVGFMTVYYFGAGLVAIVALAVNGVLILAIMALNHAAFSLPGIAGFILTFGMAVDANVLIYERMREEMQRGENLRTAVRLGYQRALASIVDGNLTNLIVCVVLIALGTQEIRGFGLTMSIGVLTTLFCQLYLTRVIFAVGTEKLRLRRLPMLPTAVPAVQRALTLNVDWMRYRGIWYALSISLTLACLGMLVARGENMLDNEFRGGTKVTIRLAEENGARQTLTRAQVQERLDTLVDRAARSSDPEERTLASLNPEIVVVNPGPDGVSSGEFFIKTALTNAERIQRAISAAFQDKMAVQPALRFTGWNIDEPRQAPVRPIISPELGEVLERPGLRVRVPEFVGGAAILIENLEPAVALRDLEERLNQARAQPEFSETLGRAHRFVILDGTEQAVRAAVLLAHDDNLSFLTDEARWGVDMRATEWRLLVAALTRSTSLAGVESFDAQIAKTFTAQAIVAIVISGVLIIAYVWVRFASIRYSLATIATSVHDCLVAVGFLALAQIVYFNAPGFAASIGLLPFQIDLNVIAAVLTILGYSLNDTVVVMDRIRENKGKLPYASRKVINDSINQTMSRTLITGTSALVATFVLYILGGEAIRAFSFTFVVGLIVGTYSSIAVAAPICWSRKLDPRAGGPAPQQADRPAPGLPPGAPPALSGGINGLATPDRRPA